MYRQKRPVRGRRKSTACLLMMLAALTAAALWSGAGSASARASGKGASGGKNTVSAAASSAAGSSAAGLTVRFLDVGQGDSALVVCDGEAMLVDGGESSESSKIYSVLKSQGITKLKYIVATHPHADHAGGLPGALGAASCEKVLSPVSDSDNASFQKLEKKCREKKIPIEVPAEGDTYTLGGAAITILGPTDEIPDDPNNNSLFFRLDYGTVSFLFTGDAEQMEQQLIMFNEYDSLKADVLKMPHHGSSNGASEAFLNAVDPDYAVISCGYGNSYGHPHEETVSLLQQHGTKVYRTDLQGDIVCTSDGKRLTFAPEKTTAQDLYSSGSELESAAQKSTAGAAGADTHPYIVNKNTGKFHYPSCGSVKKMKESNKRSVTATREQMIADGYSPCGNCKP